MKFKSLSKQLLISHKKTIITLELGQSQIFLACTSFLHFSASLTTFQNMFKSWVLFKIKFFQHIHNFYISKIDERIGNTSKSQSIVNIKFSLLVHHYHIFKLLKETKILQNHKDGSKSNFPTISSLLYLHSSNSDTKVISPATSWQKFQIYQNHTRGIKWSHTQLVSFCKCFNAASYVSVWTVQVNLFLVWKVQEDFWCI